MKFDRLLRITSFGLVITGVLLLALSGEFSPGLWLLTALALPVAWRRFRAPLPGRAATVVWNIALTTILAALLLAGATTGNWLLHMIHFGIVMAVAKLFWIKRAKDLLQLYTLSFLLVLGAAVTNPGLSFAPLFLVYVVLLTWGLILLHLMREMESCESAIASMRGHPVDETGRGASWRADRLVSRSFLVGTSLLAVTIFCCSLLIFFLFPRLGMGFFFGKTRSGQTVSGFGNEVALGHFGTIRDDPSVIMRVELPDEQPDPARRLRLRGMSFDAYDGRSWRKTSLRARPMPSRRGGYYEARPDLPPIAPELLVRQEIYLEPLSMGRRVLFGLPQVRLLRRPNAQIKELQEQVTGMYSRMRFLYDHAGDATYSGGARGTALAYTVLSDTRPELTRSGREPLSAELLEHYLALPDELDPRIAALARQLVGDDHPRDDRAERDLALAQALEDSLQGGWSYSTVGGHDPNDPLSDFLFSRREGHCEYFATAMAVMARTLGLPARVVNGFYGGVYNPYGDFHAIRQSDAHSWVEIHLPEFGWLTFDPTPVAERVVPGGTGLLSNFQARLDSLRLRWYKWVIEYDLDKQLGVFRSIMAFMSGLRLPVGEIGQSESFRALRESIDDFKHPRVVLVPGAILLLFVLWRIRRRWRVSAKPPRATPAAHRAALKIWRRVERRLARRGCPRGATLSPREWLREIEEAGHPKLEIIADGAHALEEVLWGERPLTASRRAALLQAAKVASIV